MPRHDDEEALLRSIAKQNARSILLAQEQAEHDLIKVKEELGMKSQELARSLAMVRATLEATTDGILVTDNDYRITDFNEIFLKMWRIPAEMIEKRDHRMVSNEISRNFSDANRYRSRIDEIYSISPPESYDRMELNDGRTIVRYSRIQFVDERNVGRVWSFRDITEHRQTEIARELLASIVAASDDAIISKTLKGIVTSWNAGAERHFGYTAEEAVGQHISFLIPPDRIDEEELIIARLRSGERVDHFDTIRLRKDGQPIEVSLTISPIRDASGEIVGASKIARDITERRRMENELVAYAADMSEMDRRKNEFLAMLAHELRNPLAPIRNALQIIRITAGDDVSDAAELMERQISQLVRLVDDLLDVSRITTGKIELRKEQIDMNTVVSQAVEAARPGYESGGIDLKVSVPAEPVYLVGDPARLTQVVGNLLNNASKFTKEGGAVRLILESDGDRIVVRVLDNGIGIAPEKLSNIFEMFVQADTSLERSIGGLGIGLSLVKNLVEMHGGRVTARSEGLGRGSEFVIDLPVAPPFTELSETDDLAKEIQKTGAGKRILVVDDNLDSAESLSVLLELSGHDVRLAHDGIDAVKTSDEFRPDVILLDIGLPRMNGYEAARVIRRRPWGNGVTLIALTGWGQKEDRERSKDAGFDTHLVKPVDHDELLRLLEVMEPDQSKQEEI